MREMRRKPYLVQYKRRERHGGIFLEKIDKKLKSVFYDSTVRILRYFLFDWFASFKTSHRDVLKIYCAEYCYNGERSCPLPLGMAVAIPHPFHRFERYAPAGAGLGSFAVCGRRPKAPPLDFASCAQLDQL